MRILASGVLLALAVSSEQSAQTWSRSYLLNGTTPQWVENITPRVGGGYFASVRSDPGPCVITIEADGAASKSLCVPRDGFGDVLAMPDGGALVYGPLIPMVTGKIAWVARMDRSGAILWSRQYAARPYVGFDAATPTRDGGVVFGGSLGPNALWIRLDARGAVQQQRLYEVTGTSAIHVIRDLAGGGYLLAGQMRGKPWLLKVSDSGDIQRQVSLPIDGHVRDVQPMGNGYLAIGAFGQSVSSGGYWIARLDADLKPLWQRGAAAPSGFGELTSLSIGSTIVAAGSTFIHETAVAQLVAFSATGSVLWQKDFPLADGIKRLEVSRTDDGFVFGAIAEPDNRFVIHKIGAAGETDACLSTAVSPSTLQFGPIIGTTTQYDAVAKPATVVGSDAPLNANAIQVASGGACKTPERPKTPPVMPESPAVAAIRKWNEALQKEEYAFSVHVRTLLMDRKFAELETLASELRRTKAEFADGYPKLIQFYEALAWDYPSDTEKNHQATVEAWRKAGPRSTPAIVASAMTDFTYAWKARGGGYSNTIGESAAKRFDTLVEDGRKLLQSAGADAALDPGYQMIRVQLWGTSCDQVDEITRSKEVRATANVRVLRVSANFLLPRWCGDVKAYRDYAEYAADITKNQSGDALYALIAWEAFAVERDEAFAEYHFNWERIRKGFADVIHKYPKVPRNYHRLTKMAFFQGDKATVREQLARPELAWLPGAEDVWDSKRQLEFVRESAAK